jgi:hypothetical protein
MTVYWPVNVRPPALPTLGNPWGLFPAVRGNFSRRLLGIKNLNQMYRLKSLKKNPAGTAGARLRHIAAGAASSVVAPRAAPQKKGARKRPLA